jgi:hypothetical protein
MCVAFGMKAQYDNDVWVVGYTPIIISFKDTPTISSYGTFPAQQFRIGFGQSNISKDEKLIFACNGFHIYNDTGAVVENGSYIVPNKFVDDEQICRRPQFSIILPKKDNQFYVFSTGMSNHRYDLIDSGGEFIFDLLQYSIVDMSANSGQGKVLEKSKELISNGRVSANSMTACKHANGRDWWLIKPEYTKQIYYTYLVTPEKVNNVVVQNMGGDTLSGGNWGQSAFNQEGTKYAITHYGGECTMIYDFDRCSGTLSNPQCISFPHYDSITLEEYIGTGLCFSPNGRYLYILSYASVWQYDLELNEYMNVRKDSLWNDKLNLVMGLGDDHRIYIGNFQLTTGTMGLIEFPDKKGLACNYSVNCFETNTINASAPPNMPNYELGALKGSSCDTIGKLQSVRIVIYPNPASSSFHLFIPLMMNTKVKASLYDVLGQRITEWNEILNSKQEVELKLNHVAMGMYTLKIEAGEETYIGKLSVE